MFIKINKEWKEKIYSVPTLKFSKDKEKPLTNTLIKTLKVCIKKRLIINFIFNKVCVVGNPANTNALIASLNAPTIPKENFTALTRLYDLLQINKIFYFILLKRLK